MSTSEIAEAADRLRKLRSGPPPYYDDIYHPVTPGSEPHKADERLVIDAYLAEHLADKDQPIDAEWLQGLGFTVNPRAEFLYDRLIDSKDGWELFLRLDESKDWEVSLMQNPVGGWEARGLAIPTCHPKTRGHLLCLAAALSIPLNTKAGQ